MHHDLVSKLYSVYVGRCQSWETIAFSRLQDSGENVNWEKERKKSEGAGERQGAPIFPDPARLIFVFLF